MDKNIIISIDDISPHMYSGRKSIQNCIDFIKKMPNAKFVFFIPIAYKRISGRVQIISEEEKPIINIINKEPLYLSNHVDFCNILLSLPGTNFQFGYHGYYHSKIDRPGKSNNNEFLNLNYSETIDKIKLMEDEVIKSNLKHRFSKIFRPPGWRISNEAIKAFLDNNYTLHLHKDINYDLTDIKNLNNIYYLDYMPPEIPLNNNNNNNIHIVYHACEWLKNYTSNVQFDELIQKYKNYKIKFNFLN